MDDEIKALLKEPDAVLLSRGKDLDRHLGLYTVPLFFFNGEPGRDTLFDMGSAILAKIGHKAFLLTAGHCVDLARRSACVGVGIARDQHRFVPRFASIGRATDGDYGYLELDPVDAKWVETKDRVFAGPNRISPMAADEIRGANDWMVVSGFPGDLQKWAENPVTGEYGHRVQQLHTATGLAGIGDAPEGPHGELGADLVEVWLPEKGNLDTMSGAFSEIDVPRFGGISGGGYWKGGVRPDPTGWTEDRMRIVGIHIGSIYKVVRNGDEHRFSRAVPVLFHLRLIAQEHHDLRAWMVEHWPGVAW